MLQSCKAIYDHGQIRWLTEKPTVEETRVIVSMLTFEAGSEIQHQRVPLARIAQKRRILGDIAAPVAPEGDWAVLI